MYISKHRILAHLKSPNISREDNNDTADEVTHFHFKGNPQDLMLGSPPRKKYPLVVCVVRQDCLAEADPSTVVRHRVDFSV